MTCPTHSEPLPCEICRFVEWFRQEPSGVTGPSCSAAWNARAAIAKQELAALERKLSFAKSVIKSGEGWTETCEKEFNGKLIEPEKSKRETRCNYCGKHFKYEYKEDHWIKCPCCGKEWI